MLKMSRIFRWFVWLVMILASAMIIISLIAGQLGMDNDRKWGPFRLGFLTAGMMVFGLIICLWLVDALDRRMLTKKYKSNLAKVEMVQLVPAEPSSVSKDFTWIGLVGFIVGMGLVYTWFVSVGHWTVWPQTTQYYDMLADAFLHGQTALLIEPPPELASLKYPWPTNMRPGIAVLADASYYQGNYYLYWGPAPAGMAAIWKFLFHTRIGDEQIVFVAASLMMVFSVLIVLDLKQRYYPEIPIWLLGSSLLVITTVHPLLWNLNHPAIHEASITSGQAFLLAGLFFALPTITTRNIRFGRLILAGTMWGLALASRLTLLGAIGVLILGTIWGWSRVWVKKDRKIHNLVSLAGLVLPIICSLGLLGIYNYIRFDNPLEPGLRYQLSTVDLGRLSESGSLFNRVYVFPNFLYYLLTPLRFRETFPFIRPFFGKYPLFSAFLKDKAFSPIYHVEDITGLLVVMPFVFVAILCFGICIWRVSGYFEKNRDQISPIRHLQESGGLIRMAGLLYFASFLAFVPVVLYFWVATRFMLDFTPLLMLAAVISTWAAVRMNHEYSIMRSLISFLIISALISTVCVSLLLAVTGADSRFDDLNPVLWYQLIHIFSP